MVVCFTPISWRVEKPELSSILTVVALDVMFPACVVPSEADWAKLTGVVSKAEPIVSAFVPLLKVNLEEAPKAPALLN